MQWPKSLNELDDAELAEAVRDMMAVIHRITGVDPADWSREAADVGPDELSTPNETMTGHKPDQLRFDRPANSSESGASAAPGDLEKMRDCLRRFENVVTDPAVPSKKERQANLVFCKDVWKVELKGREDFVRSCTGYMNKVLKDEISIAAARGYLEGLIH